MQEQLALRLTSLERREEEPLQFVEWIKEQLPLLTSIDPIERGSLAPLLSSCASLEPLFEEHFSTFLRLYVHVFPTPPFQTEKEPPALGNLFKRGSAKERLLQIQSAVGQFPIQKKLYLAVRIAQQIQLIKKQVGDKIHLFSEWLELVESVIKEALKKGVQCAESGQPYQPLIRAALEATKRALTASKADKKVQGLHIPGKFHYCQPRLLPRHYQLVFAFNLAGLVVTVLQECKMVSPQAFNGFKIVLANFLKDSYPLQELLEGCTESKGEHKSQYAANVVYNPAGVAFLLLRWLGSQTCKFALSPAYRLKLILPATIKILGSQANSTGITLQLIQALIENLNLVKQVTAINQFCTRLDQVLTLVLENLGSRNEKKCQSEFLAVLQRVISALPFQQRIRFFKGVSNFSTNGALLGIFVKKMKSICAPWYQTSKVQVEAILLKYEARAKQGLAEFACSVGNLLTYIRIKHGQCLSRALVERLTRSLEKQIGQKGQQLSRQLERGEREGLQRTQIGSLRASLSQLEQLLT